MKNPRERSVGRGRPQGRVVLQLGWREAAHLGMKPERVCYMERDGGGETKFQLIIASPGLTGTKIQKCPLD